jgi:hypothetical protein
MTVSYSWLMLFFIEGPATTVGTTIVLKTCPFAHVRQHIFRKAIIGLSVQLFFAWRIRILTTNWWRRSWLLVGLVCATSITSAGEFPLVPLGSCVHIVAPRLVAGILTSWNGVAKHSRFDQFQETHVSSASCSLTVCILLWSRAVELNFATRLW